MELAATTAVLSRGLASGYTPKCRWRVLYKPYVVKQVAVLQWRIIHGAIAVNRYRGHFNLSTAERCPFCAQWKALEHLGVSCPGLSLVI